MVEENRLGVFGVVKQSDSFIDLHVGSRISLRRKMLGMTIAEVAAATGIPGSLIEAMESGTRPINALQLHTFTKVFDIPITWFFQGLGRDGDVQHGGGLPSREVVRDVIAADEQTELFRYYFENISDTRLRDSLLHIAQTYLEISSGVDQQKPDTR